ncbi:hypothetical protein ES702_01565 [subsurface metagenome]
MVMAGAVTVPHSDDVAADAVKFGRNHLHVDPLGPPSKLKVNYYDQLAS